MINLIAVVFLPLDTHFMKNCRNREVQPVQFLPPCAQEHVFDDWFSLLVPQVDCGADSEPGVLMSAQTITSETTSTTTTTHITKVSPQKTGTFFFFFFHEVVCFLNFSSIIYFKTWTHAYTLWTKSCLFWVPVFIHLSLAILASLMHHPRTWQES